MITCHFPYNFYSNIFFNILIYYSLFILSDSTFATQSITILRTRYGKADRVIRICFNVCIRNYYRYVNIIIYCLIKYFIFYNLYNCFNFNINVCCIFIF